MSLPAGPVVPPGQHPPFATITPTDHAAWILVSSTLGLSLILLFAAIRVFIHQSNRQSYGVDDYLVGIATVLGVVQAVILLSACHDGLGRSRDLLSEQSANKVQQLYYVSTLFFIPAVAASRASVLAFQLKLTPIIWHLRSIYAMLIATAVLGVGSLLALALSCNLSRPWDILNHQCPGYLLRWNVTESIGCLIEILLVLFAVWMVWGLQTSFSNKAIVVFTFSFRLLMIVIVALRLSSFDESGMRLDPTLLEAQFIAWTSAELNYSIISATIPILRPFIATLSTTYGGQGGFSGDAYGSSWSGGKGSSSAARGGATRSIPMNLLNRSRNGRNTTRSWLEGDKEGAGTSTAHAEHPTYGTRQKDIGDATSVESDDSQRMIIRKDVSWNVVTQAAEGPSTAPREYREAVRVSVRDFNMAETKQDVAEHEMWEGLNIEYENAYQNNPYKKACVAKAIELLPAGARVLDIGCGTGVPVSKMLADAGLDVVGTDVAPKMVELAESRIKGHFEVADTVEYEPKGHFAAVFIIYSQLGLSYPAFHSAAVKFAKALQPGGLMVIGQSPADDVPADASEWDLTRSYVDGYNLPFMGEPFATLMFTREGQKKYMRDLGMEIVYDTVDIFQPDSAKSDPETQQYVIGQLPHASK
nr:hypothetical protein B0A51_18303 [Rachicladosporium sp. CCFEE 5018]